MYYCSSWCWFTVGELKALLQSRRKALLQSRLSELSEFPRIGADLRMDVLLVVGIKSHGGDECFRVFYPAYGSNTAAIVISVAAVAVDRTLAIVFVLAVRAQPRYLAIRVHPWRKRVAGPMMDTYTQKKNFVNTMEDQPERERGITPRLRLGLLRTQRAFPSRHAVAMLQSRQSLPLSRLSAALRETARRAFPRPVRRRPEPMLPIHL